MEREHEQPPTISVTSPAEFLGVVPYLLGYHPQPGRIVLVGMSHRKVIAAVSVKVADLGSLPDVAKLFRGNGCDRAMVVAYGGDDITGTALAFAHDLSAGGLSVVEVLRADANRYYCLNGDNGPCTPAGGLAYDPASTVSAATSTYLGLAALPHREALDDLFTLRPDAGLATLITALREAADHLVPDGQFDRQQCRIAVDHAVGVAGSGGRLDDAAVGRVLLAVQHAPTRDYAWGLSHSTPAVLDVWIDVTARCALRGLAAAPATLASLCAWLSGNGALAVAAINAALTADPTYRLGIEVNRLLAQGAPPATARQLLAHVRATAADAATGGCAS